MFSQREHIDWCKKRALEYVDDGDLTNAYASFMSDMSKHDETANNMALRIGNALFFNGQLSTIGDMRRWINGF